MPKILVNINERAKEFACEGFYVNDGKILMCQHCNRRVDWKSKDTVVKHCKSKHHIERKQFSEESQAQGQKRQSTISASLQVAKKAKLEKIEFIEETVKMCLKANIPLEKLDHVAVRSYLNRYIKGAGDLPKANHLRREYMPKIGEAAKQEVKESIHGKQVAIILDETTDRAGHCVLAILFKCLVTVGVPEVFLGSVYFLDKADATTCCQAVIDTVTKFEVLYSDIICIVSDSAPYMIKCFSCLQVLIGSHLLHIPCWAHKLHLVGAIFMHELTDLNRVVCKVKNVFLNTRKLKSAYLSFLKEKFPNLVPKLYPEPIITRWNSWFKAVFYLAEYFKAIFQFIAEYKPKSCPMKTLMDLTNEPDFINKVQTECIFVLKNCKTIAEFITELEGSNYPLAHVLNNKLASLKRHLHLLAEGEFGSEVEFKANEMSTNVWTTTQIQLKAAAQKSFNKLAKHSTITPTIQVYEAIGILFDPKTVVIQGELNINTVKTNFMSLNQLNQFDFNSFYLWYQEFYHAIVEAVKKNQDGMIDIVTILVGLRCYNADISNKVLMLVWLPVASVDCERFFSLYNIIVTDRRQNMTHNSIESCALLAFNEN